VPVPARKEITEELLIVGEGDGDEAFFRYLCEVRNVPGFQFDCANGISDFETFLKGLPGRSGISKLRAVLIVGDNDETPDANFSIIQKQIGRAKLPQPQNPLSRVARGDLTYRIAVLMLPYPRIGNTSHGCLESLLLPAIERNFDPELNCLDSFCQCITGCGKYWSRTSRDKMRLRCLLSSCHPDDPNLGLRYALKPTLNLVPLDDHIFDEVHELLLHFADWMSAAQHPSWFDWKAANLPVAGT